MKSNYAFKPIAEQALGSNQTIVPQRLNAALAFFGGLMANLLALMIALFANAAGAEAPETLKVSHLVLYQADAVLRSRIRSDAEFTKYIKEINVAVGAVLSETEVQEPQSGAVVVVVKPNSLIRVWFAEAEGKFDPGEKKEIIRAIEGVPVLLVNGGAVAVAIGYSDDGSAPTDSSLPIPEEWKSAIPKGVTVDIPDDVMAIVWPTDGES